MQKIIEVKNLKKSYGAVEAVKGIDFYVDSGTQFAFLGPNGAGKSTTIDILCTLSRADSGQVTVNGSTLGEDDNAIRSSIGVVFQKNMLDQKLTVRENLAFRASFYDLRGEAAYKAVNFALEVSGCQSFADRYYGNLSGGQKRRADIARAFLNTPKILFLDEPTTGLDPHTRQSVWETVNNLQKDLGLTIFLTTHYMEEAAQADYVAVIDNGLITAKGTPFELREKYSSDDLYMKAKDAGALAAKLSALDIEYTKKADVFVVKLISTMHALPILEKVQDGLSMFEVKSGTMDDAFINITGGVL